MNKDHTTASVTFADVQAAATRIHKRINNTPIIESSLLNQWLGQRILFKAECFQRTGAFKLRGACNFVRALLESGQKVTHIVANSSGNHAQAVAYAAAQANIPVTIFTTESISPVKAAATQDYGADLRLYPTRQQADEAVQVAAEQDGVVWIPPFNHPLIVAGQGTAVMEAIAQIGHVDSVFAPCGGGGLLSGSLLATRTLAPNAQVIGVEPAVANDASRSLQSGQIEPLSGPVNTLADGAATPAVAKLTFDLLQQLDDFYEVSEQQIAYWTQWLQHLLKVHVEPTSAMTMAAVAAWAASADKEQTALVTLSGGNISQATMAKVWATDYLDQPPIITQ